MDADGEAAPPGPIDMDAATAPAPAGVDPAVLANLLAATSGGGGGGGVDAATLAAALSAAAGGGGGPSGGGGNLQAAALAAALAAAAGGGGGGFGAPPPRPAAPPPPPPPPVVVYGPPPPWAAAVAGGAPLPPAVHPAEEALPSPVPVPPGGEVALAAALAAALGVPVRVVGPTGPPAVAAPAGSPAAAAPAAPSIPVTLDGAGALSPAALDAALARATSPARLRGRPRLPALAGVAARAGAAAPPALAALLISASARAALAALAPGAADDDDLFFEGGAGPEALAAALADGSVPPSFVDALAAAAGAGPQPASTAHLTRGLVAALAAIGGASPAIATDLPDAWAARLRGLDVAARPAGCQRALAALLLREAAAAPGLPHPPGPAFERASALAPLLAVTTFPDVPATLRSGGADPASRSAGAGARTAAPARALFEAIRGYPACRYGEVEAASRQAGSTLRAVAATAAGLADRVARLKDARPGGVGREAVLAWCAAAAGALASRAAGGDKGALEPAAVVGAASDAFGLGAATLALRLCRPFLGGGDKWLPRLGGGDFYGSPVGRARAPGLAREPTLAGRGAAAALVDGEEEEEDEEDEMAGGAPARRARPPPSSPPPPRPYLSPTPPGADPASPGFVAECFHASSRLFHVGLMPAVNRFTEGWDRMARAARADGGEGGGGVGLEEALFRDSGLAALLEPELAADATGFAVLTIAWLARLLAEGGPDAVAAVPEFVLRDAAAWVGFCVRCGGADVVGGSDVASLVGGVSAFLRADGVAARSPLSAAACVEMLQAMLAPQLDKRRVVGGDGGGASLGPTLMSPGERALVASVLATGAAQAALIPALMRAHAGADVVVGLDVDRDRFDKFGFRSQVDALLMELWNDETCLGATARLAGEAGGADAFDAYVSAVLNSLIYLLDDCLVRLQAMADVEAAKRAGGGAAWAALPARERAAKEAFLQGEAGTTRGFMGMALRCLAVLARLSGEAPIVAASFGARPELAAQAAHAVSAFVNAVAGCDPGEGGGRRAVQVEAPERFKYDPPSLLASILAIALRIDVAMVGAGGPGLAPHLAGEAEFDAGPARRAAGVVGGRGDFGSRSAFEALVDRAVALRDSGRDSAAAPAATGASTTLVPALPPSVPPPPADLAGAYAAALAPLAFGEWDSNASPASYSRVLGAQSLPPGSALPRKAAKRIAKELRDLGAPGGLPLSTGASIFIRADPDRADRLRALVTGPEGTPYAGGCFIFDLLFPPAYPDVPPVMLLATTGGGRARFNPNLYADGKVCLSLLGTWHGTDESEKWSAADANVWRVLVSIQGMILVDDPYFNEPGADAVRGTPEGRAQAARYNAKLAANVVRYAMAAHLEAPPPGFEDVVGAHFRAMRHKVVAWAGEAAAAAEAAGDGAAARRLGEEVTGLVGKLAAL